MVLLFSRHVLRGMTCESLSARLADGAGTLKTGLNLNIGKGWIGLYNLIVRCELRGTNKFDTNYLHRCSVRLSNNTQV